MRRTAPDPEAAAPEGVWRGIVSPMRRSRARSRGRGRRGRRLTSGAVPHVLIAADADWLIDDVRSALEGPDTTFAVCRTGQAVTVAATQQAPDLAILDLQIGNMGGMAVSMTLRLDESGAGCPTSGS